MDRNIMDRDGAAGIGRLAAFGGLTGEDAAGLLPDCCTGHGRDPGLPVASVQAITGTGMLRPYLMEALEYGKKCTMDKLQSKPDNTGQGQIILMNQTL